MLATYLCPYSIARLLKHVIGLSFDEQPLPYQIGGVDGALSVSTLLQSRGVSFEFLLDEGLAIVDGILVGVPVPAAL